MPAWCGPWKAKELDGAAPSAAPAARWSAATPPASKPPATAVPAVPASAPFKKLRLLRSTGPLSASEELREGLERVPAVATVSRWRHRPVGVELRALL